MPIAPDLLNALAAMLERAKAPANSDIKARLAAAMNPHAEPWYLKEGLAAADPAGAGPDYSQMAGSDFVFPGSVATPPHPLNIDPMRMDDPGTDVRALLGQQDATNQNLTPRAQQYEEMFRQKRERERMADPKGFASREWGMPEEQIDPSSAPPIDPNYGYEQAMQELEQSGLMGQMQRLWDEQTTPSPGAEVSPIRPGMPIPTDAPRGDPSFDPKVLLALLAALGGASAMPGGEQAPA